MDSQQFRNVFENKLSLSISLQLGNRNERLERSQIAGLSPDELKDELARARADSINAFFFVEEDGADELVKQAAQHWADKMDFKGDIVASTKPSSNGKNYYFVRNEPQEPILGEGW